jgi:hypothetical protein
MNHAFLHEYDALVEQMKEFSVYCPRTEVSHDATRNKILKDEYRQTKRLLLSFPCEMKLSNSPYSPNSTDGEIEIDIVPYQSDFELLDKTWTTTEARISWKVSIIEVEKRVIKASKDKNRAASKLAEKLSSMHL